MHFDFHYFFSSTTKFPFANGNNKLINEYFCKLIILSFGQETQKQVFWPYLWNYGEAQILFLEGVREEDREIVLLFFF